MEVGHGPWKRRVVWHFGRWRWEWLDGCVVLGYRIEFQVKAERETRIR